MNAMTKNFQNLNRKVKLKIKEHKIMICAFFMMLIKNMLQQIDNNDFLRHIVFINCRFCLCFKNEKHDFEFNIVIEERFYKQTMHDKEKIKHEKITN